MYAFAVHPSTHGGFCREDSYLPISTLYDCLCSWYCHSEDMLPDKYFSLHPPQCMDARGIAREYDHICSASPESLDSRLRELSDLISRLSSVWSMCSVHLEDHSGIWKGFLEVFHDDLTTES